MRSVIATLITLTTMTMAQAETINFDRDEVGKVPAGWTAGVTGRGSPKWLVQADPTAPSKPNVLMQSGQGTFPWCVKKDVSIGDGFVEVKFKSISGRECARKQRVLVPHQPRQPNYY